MTAVTFFTVYNTRDAYDYDYHWFLGFLTFISTIATPIFFVIAGYVDAQSRHVSHLPLRKMRNVLLVFLFWTAVYYLWPPYQRGYIIQPWFVLSFVIIYAFHPVIAWLSCRRWWFCITMLLLLIVSYCYDLLSALYPHVHLLSLAPQYRLWTWLLFYLTGQIFFDPLIADWLGRDKVVKTVMVAIPFIYLLTWLYERYFFFSIFKLDRNAFTLTGSQIYILVVALVIAANGVRFRRNAAFKDVLLSTMSKTMTGVYVLHYFVFHVLTAFIPIHSLFIKLIVIALTFIVSVLISMVVLSNPVTKRLITI